MDVREPGGTRTYILRPIPGDLWTEVKARASAEGRSLRWVLLALIRGYAEGTITIRSSGERPAAESRPPSVLRRYISRLRRFLARGTAVSKN